MKKVKIDVHVFFCFENNVFQVYTDDFFLDLESDPKVAALRNQTTYYGEYRRVIDETPKTLAQTLTARKDQVVYVTFSHDGEIFLTCFKDCTLKVKKINLNNF